MNADQHQIQAVPTNIITGFLGVGKTSAILRLMRHKPDHERWAILVNEFGEIGVDGSLFQGQHSEEQGVFIREVPGGCMCCAAGLPMTVALNQLLAQAKPDRLLIEPTGLGHPKEVLETLSADHYKHILSLQKTLTLVDARKLSDARYTGHDTFNQQIAIADTIVGNKLDLYQDGDKENLTAYATQYGQPGANVIFTEHGDVAVSQLKGETSGLRSQPDHHHHEAPEKPLASDSPMPQCGFIKAQNEGEGFKSVGWRFSPKKIFNREKVVSVLSVLTVDRMKAVLITDSGFFAYNLTADALTETELEDCLESRIEVIADTLDESLESQLLACLEQ